MDCNKEEACRAKEIAEKKFTEKDIIGAKRFATKAQRLYPALDGISQFMTTLDVYIMAEERKNGEIDWYRVLGVPPSAHDDTIRRSYRKLLLTFHPDKNKSIGASGAFKIISDAWNLLSDKVKKTAYDRQIGNVRVMDQNVPIQNPPMPFGQNDFREPPTPTGLNDLFGFPNRDNSSARGRGRGRGKGKGRPSAENLPRRPRPPTHTSKPNTFWTTCGACQVQFEYQRSYLNCSMLCHNCGKPFFAVETPIPSPMSGSGQSSMQNAPIQRQNSTPPIRVENSSNMGQGPASTTNMGARVQQDTFFNPWSFGGTPSAAFLAAQTENWRKSSAFAAREFWMSQMNPEVHFSFGSNEAASASVGNAQDGLRKTEPDDERRFGNLGPLNSNFEVRSSFVAGNHKPNLTVEVPQIDIHNILVQRAKKHISGSLNKWSTMAAASDTAEKVREKMENIRQRAAVKDSKAEADECLVTSEIKARSSTNMPPPADFERSDPMSMAVIDPDFHDFDNDRTGNAFRSKQVWAAYDGDDGMPRYYAIIHEVISPEPYKVKLSWLNSKSNSELGPLNWIDSGFCKTIGDFRVGKHEIYTDLYSFSHKVKWTKGTRGAIHIYPVKGDVWALYKNWSPEWNELTPDDVVHKYDMVRVLEDFNEERGVTVVPLVKVPGFKTLFHEHRDSKRVRTIPREELFRLSHQIPCYLITGQEGPNAPNGCWELDPASTPTELLEVLTEIEVKETLVTSEKSEKELKDARTSKEQVVGIGDTGKGKCVLEDVAAEDVPDDAKKRKKEFWDDDVMIYKRR